MTNDSNESGSASKKELILRPSSHGQGLKKTSRLYLSLYTTAASDFRTIETAAQFLGPHFNMRRVIRGLVSVHYECYTNWVLLALGNLGIIGVLDRAVLLRCL
jgi:hypothetical protein